MEPGEFVKKWQEYNQRRGQEAAEFVKFVGWNFQVNVHTSQFLKIAGLPRDSRIFRTEDEDRLLKPLPSVYGPDDWNDLERARLKPYLLVADHLGAGDPLCVDTRDNDAVIVLWHEGSFEDRTFVNSSISQYAGSLLIHAELYEQYGGRFGEDADPYEEGDPAMPADLLAQAAERFRVADAAAMNDGAFWKRELEELAKWT